MRATWIALLTVFVDLLSKLIVVHGEYHISFSLLGATFVVGDRAWSAHIAENNVDISGWLLAASVLSGFFLFVRRLRPLISLSLLTDIGVQLVSGGLLSLVVDQFLYGAVVPLLMAHFPYQLDFSMGFGHLAILVGGGILLLEMVRSPRTAVGLFPAYIPTIDFSMLPRGVDNVHIDVLLSPSFTKIAHSVVYELIPKYIKLTKLGGRRLNLPNRYFERLQAAYAATIKAALVRAKQTGEPQLLELVYVAVIKFLHGEIHRETQAAIQRYTDLLHDQRKRGAGGGGDSHVQWLFRHRGLLFYRVSSALFGALLEAERLTVAKLRQSLFGNRPVVALDAMRLALVQAASPANDGVQVEQYLLLGSLAKDPNSFPVMDDALRAVFADVLAAMPADLMSGLPVLETATASEGIASEYLRALAQPSVLMAEENVPILLDAAWLERRTARAKEKQKRRDVKKLRRHRRFQQRLAARLWNTLEQRRLLPHVVASYEIRRLFRDRQWDVDVQILHKLLRLEGTAAEVKRKIQNNLRTAGAAPPIEEIMEAWSRVQSLQVTDMTALLLRFVTDFSAYRRHLAMEYCIQQAAQSIVLLEDEKAIKTSRANFTLHDFLPPDEKGDRHVAIRRHVIMKADLRGSTEVTDKLVELNLNPAAHFSRYFFDPINEVIELFGAEKVFIEGDAIILMLNEYVTEHQERLGVARMCGLGAEILRVVESQNRQLAAHQLPQIELGIGIAYCESAPRFLFDGDRRITISPAINRADRLSACAYSVRDWFARRGPRMSRVAVFEPSADASTRQEKAQKDLVYNMNGILIEPAAFEKLKKETTLKPVRNTLPEFEDSRLFGCRFPDIGGTVHTLVIREAPVRVHLGDRDMSELPVVGGRRYYEVIHDKAVLQRLSGGNVAQTV